MDRRLRNLIIFFSVAFVALSLNLTYLQFFKSEEILASRHNIRSLAEELATKRGTILTSDGLELAESERTSGKIYKRFYPAGEVFSAITGFYDSRYGRFVFEQKYNNQLLGQDQADTLSDHIDRIVGRGQPGNDLILSIDSKLQRIAYKNLIGRRGAIVAIEPKTGEVMALASSPGYNPNTVRKEWKKLNNDKNSPLFNRATSGLYAPGSVFKTVTLTGALAKDPKLPTKIYPAPSSIKIYGGTVTNYKDKEYDKVSLQKAYKLSINTVFAKVGLELGGQALVEQAKKFGIGKDFNFDLDMRKSTIKPASEMDDLEVAWTSVGQAHTLVTPLQMAMVASGIANKGVLMKPYLVHKIRDYKGQTVEKTKPKMLFEVATQTDAILVRSLMIQVVKDGTGTAAAIEGVEVAGKTGTAEIKGRPPHAWFIAFAPAKAPKIAIAVLVENGGTGGSRAAPLARQVIEEALEK